MIGLRGVPATFGGVERHVEELGARLADRGHDVTVFCRPGYSEVEDAGDGVAPMHRGMHLRTMPTIATKHGEAFVHSIVSAAAAVRGFDVVHFHSIGPGIAAPITRYLSRSKAVLTVHGRDDERDKWGRLAQRLMRVAAWTSGRVPNATVVVSKGLVEDYRARGVARPVHYVPNGVTVPAIQPPGPYLAANGITEGRYVLFVGRLVPEKAPDLLIRAFRDIEGDDLRLVIAGGSSHTDDYVSEVERLAAGDPRVLLAGYVYGDDLGELYGNAGAFCQPSRLEGLPLTLLEAASCGIPIVASDIPPHVEVVADAEPGGRLFRTDDQQALTDALRAALDPERRSTTMASAATLRDRVMATYTWDGMTDAVESIYQDVVAGRTPRPTTSADAGTVGAARS